MKSLANLVHTRRICEGRRCRCFSRVKWGSRSCDTLGRLGNMAWHHLSLCWRRVTLYPRTASTSHQLAGEIFHAHLAPGTCFGFPFFFRLTFIFFEGDAFGDADSFIPTHSTHSYSSRHGVIILSFYLSVSSLLFHYLSLSLSHQAHSHKYTQKLLTSHQSHILDSVKQTSLVSLRAKISGITHW